MATDMKLGKLFETLSTPDKYGFTKWYDVKNMPRGYEKLNADVTHSYDYCTF